ncbi:MAG TPA: hypothetical protein VLJ19_19240 [Variovorax sp.]|nr:hypothetical protein [Variovorax sp.]
MSTHIVAQELPAASELERAFGAAFATVPAVAHYAGGACQHHARLAAKIAQFRDGGASSDRALELLKEPEQASPTEVDRRVATALSIIHRAVLDFVYGPSLPSVDLTFAVVNVACLIEVGKVIGSTDI